MLNRNNPISRRQVLGVLATPLIAPLLASCGTDALLSPLSPSFAADDLSITLIGAGDPHAKANNWPAVDTGRRIQAMLNQNPGARAFAVGDLTAFGTPEEFQRQYHAAWGWFKD